MALSNSLAFTWALASAFRGFTAVEEAGADENHAEEDGTAAFGDVDFAGNEAEEGLGEENYQEQ